MHPKAENQETRTEGDDKQRLLAFALIPVLRFYAFPIVVELLVLNRRAISWAAARNRRSAIPQQASLMLMESSVAEQDLVTNSLIDFCGN